ncbi:S4 domain-containing protein YaaA [Paenibacillus sp. ACRRX]|uniref:S4 domain-containing protein YaaA n=1 Tax=Paenibacillus TaxID=44249 RepID=UPI00041753A2|nr:MULTISPECIES: S4 domain-containing protein YaaA [Paenibacillus]MCG7408394.1 S4 domain-containing protein YaaA [Paenibacillus sp. ACRRX]MDK8181221.1 S4 domain-containing protein YaaA [Paenibacillus sp. UMB4589-SE434]
MKEVSIRTDYITLGQALKLADIASTGGHAKVLLQEQAVLVNGEIDERRGRKLYDGDKVEVKSEGSFRIVKSQEA